MYDLQKNKTAYAPAKMNVIHSCSNSQLQELLLTKCQYCANCFPEKQQLSYKTEMAANFWSSTHAYVPPLNGCALFLRLILVNLCRGWLVEKEKAQLCNPNDRLYLSDDEIVKARIYFCDGECTARACTLPSCSIQWNSD